MKAVFLDRDGTLIYDPPDAIVDRAEKLKLIPQTLDALKLLATLDYGVILITNQLGIATGRLSEDEFHEIHNTFLRMVEPSGITILKTYFCPHAPEDNCECRKPKPGMLLQAAKDFDIDLAHSWMIGDRLSDVQVGINAGTKTILVETGLIKAESDQATHTCPTILEAIQHIAAQ